MDRILLFPMHHPCPNLRRYYPVSLKAQPLTPFYSWPTLMTQMNNTSPQVHKSDFSLRTASSIGISSHLRNLSYCRENLMYSRPGNMKIKWNSTLTNVRFCQGSTNLGYEPGALFLKFFGKFWVGSTTPNWYPVTNLHFDIFQGTPSFQIDTNLRLIFFKLHPQGEGGCVKQLVPDTMLTNC